MSDDNDRSPSNPPKPVAAAGLSRRLVTLRGLGVAALPLGLGGCVIESNAPVSQQLRATGLTDRDPSDGPGNGRGTQQPQQRRTTGLTDRDPSDGPGNGRGTQPQQRRTTGLTDQDPTDGPGNGRGSNRAPVRRATGLTDSDPNDGPGNGRSGR